jgi:hypothetical protein
MAFTPLTLGDGYSTTSTGTSSSGVGVLSTLMFPSDIGGNAAEDTPQQMHYMVFYINEILAGGMASTVVPANSTDVPVFMESGSTSIAAALKSMSTSNTPISTGEKTNVVDKGTVPTAAEKKLYDDTLFNYSYRFQTGAANKKILSDYEAKYPPKPYIVSSSTQTSKLKADMDKAGDEAAKSGRAFLQGAYDLMATQVVRTALTVILPMPDSIQASYDAEWATDTNEVLGNVLGMADEMTSGTPNSPMKWVKAAGVKLGGSAAQTITQKASNPRTQMLFSNMSFRSFSWTWTLYPKNAEEAKSLWSIIQFLKYHQAPEYDAKTGGVFLIQPSLFDIEFHSHGKRNAWLPKTLTCVCKNITVDYGPAGAVAFFEQYQALTTDGSLVSAPIGVRLSMSFEENEILTKNRIRGDKNANKDSQLDPAMKYNFNQGPGSNQGTF